MKAKLKDKYKLEFTHAYLVVIFDAHAQGVHQNGQQYALLKSLMIYQLFDRCT